MRWEVSQEKDSVLIHAVAHEGGSLFMAAWMSFMMEGLWRKNTPACGSSFTMRSCKKGPMQSGPRVARAEAKACF
eukprot:2360484-Pyramimonas_sp.AAC.1